MGFTLLISQGIRNNCIYQSFCKKEASLYFKYSTGPFKGTGVFVYLYAIFKFFTILEIHKVCFYERSTVRKNIE